MWVISVLLLGQSAPAGRYSHCAVVYNGHMIVYGGRGFQQTEHTQKTLTTLGDVWSLNLDEMSWSLLLGAGDPSDPPDIDPLYPGQRSSHACVMLFVESKACRAGQRSPKVCVAGQRSPKACVAGQRGPSG